MKRFALVGAPGDVICGLGSAMLHPDFSFKTPDDFLYIGYSEDIAEFVRAQEFCNSCESVIVGGDGYKEAEFALTRQLPPQQSCEAYLRHMGLPVEDIYLTHIGEQAKRDYRILRWKNPKLPQAARDWAKTIIFLTTEDKPSFLLHPYSFQSNELNTHWGHWVQAILWLAHEHGDKRFFLTGQGFEHKFKADNIVDLVGKLPTFMELLALADLCDGIISTTNCLSHWSILTEKPTVSACVWGMSQPWYYFRKWVDCPPNALVEFTDPLSVFQARCNELFERAKKPVDFQAMSRRNVLRSVGAERPRSNVPKPCER